MLVKIASAEWLRKVAGIAPYVIDPMVLGCAGKTIEVTEEPSLGYTEVELDQIDELGILLPVCENTMYSDDKYTWSTLMFAETEEYNKRPPLNVGDILSFINEGGQ